jgi:oligosaccharide repeat unit polymerase
MVKGVKLTWENLPIPEIWDRKRLFLTIIIFFIISFSVFSIEVIEAGGIPLFVENRTEAYAEFGINFLHYITVSLLMLPAIVYFYLKCYMPKNRKFTAKVLLISIGVVSFFIIVSLLSKNLILHMLLFLSIFYNYIQKKKIGIKLVAILLIFLSLMMVGLAEVRFASKTLVEIAQMDIPEEYNWIAMPYIYFALNFENMNQTIKQDSPVNLTMGKSTFAPLWVFTFYKRFFSEHFNDKTQPNNLVEENFNVSTYLCGLYQEYGVPGIIIFPTLYGFITQLIYLLLRKTNSPLYMGLFAVMENSAAFAFFSNFYSHPTGNFLIIVIIVLHLFCRKRPTISELIKDKGCD